MTKGLRPARSTLSLLFLPGQSRSPISRKRRQTKPESPTYQFVHSRASHVVGDDDGTRHRVDIAVEGLALGAADAGRLFRVFHCPRLQEREEEEEVESQPKRVETVDVACRMGGCWIGPRRCQPAYFRTALHHESAQQASRAAQR